MFLPDDSVMGSTELGMFDGYAVYQVICRSLIVSCCIIYLVSAAMLKALVRPVTIW